VTRACRDAGHHWRRRRLDPLRTLQLFATRSRTATPPSLTWSGSPAAASPSPPTARPGHGCRWLPSTRHSTRSTPAWTPHAFSATGCGAVIASCSSTGPVSAPPIPRPPRLVRHGERLRRGVRSPPHACARRD
jgi:hypothetical protein